MEARAPAPEVRLPARNARTVGTKKAKKRLSGAERKKRKNKDGGRAPEALAILPQVAEMLSKAPPGGKGKSKGKTKQKLDRGGGPRKAKPWDLPRASATRVLPEHLR